MSTSTSSRRERAEEEKVKAVQEGLLNTGSEHSLFKALGVGEARSTLVMTSKLSKKKCKTSKPREQWWAPAELVRMNIYMKAHGVSSKLRIKTLRLLMEEKDLPDRLCAVVASYTESLLSRG
jgi:hypothetical protein